MKPILFNADMVRAIIDGRKTQTRRVLKPANPFRAKAEDYRQGSGLWVDYTHIKDYSVSSTWFTRERYISKYARYKPGDILYVRETWQLTDRCVSEEPGYVYKATDPDWETMEGWKWRPAIHMPKEAARLFLRVTAIRIDRLQNMTAEDSLREGVKLELVSILNGAPPLDPFARVWDSTIKPAERKLYGWEANPWVWVYEFERTEREKANDAGA